MEKLRSSNYRCFIERDINWCWKIKAPNGRIICYSPKSFDTREEAIDDFKLLGHIIMECCEKERQIR